MGNTNYFTCTLGQASLLTGKRDFKNINDFLEKQAARVGDLPAVGFFTPGTLDNKPWTTNVLTFSDIHKGTCVVAGLIAREADLQARCPVALLCPSSVEFLFVWLALIRLGHPVLLLAPQCSSSAIAHLCKRCQVGALFYNETYRDLSSRSSTEASASEDWSLNTISIEPLLSAGIYGVIKQEAINHPAAEKTSEHDVAYLHHTSGTSSGMPKPIPQTHRAALCVLPALDGKAEATFTTTPLYHGGIADLFRAWTSDAMIWLYPGKGIPFTPTNIVNCLETARRSHIVQGHPQVTYFSSVPYVLQMMAADERGLEELQQMAILGVGGAALPAEIGNKLVQQNVNLVSRFGSAECGFLMSSHRDYAKDKHWQYLRLAEGVDSLSFEPQQDGLSELVVLNGWPHVAKKNRADGSFATADLFEPHPSIKNAWRYHSRADSQLTLITGKKFDPAPLEAIIATSKLLKDVFIFGDSKPYPGALLFRSEEARHISEEELIASLRPILEGIHAESQSHVRLAQNMLLPMPFLEQPLEKSSKGTILRNKATEKYRDKMEEAYGRVSTGDGQYIEDDHISIVIKQAVISAIGRDDGLDDATDLFSYGVDSVACVQIRRALSGLLPETKSELPLTVVEDRGTIDKLTQLIISKRHGGHCVEDNPKQVMSSLLEKYTQFVDSPLSNGHEKSLRMDKGSQTFPGETILLTGATGALGSHILYLYMNSSKVAQIFCLVRGASKHAAVERVAKALSYRRLGIPTSKVKVVCADLSSPFLGLDPSVYQTLTSTVTTIHHVAWAVNFRLSVSSFSSNLASLQNLINLALSSPHQKPPNFVFCSSVASVADLPAGKLVKEEISTSTNDCGPLGYAQSKWIAESICSAANQQTQLKGRIAVVRVGQLSGATDTGIWNMSEAYPMLMSQVSLTNCLPNLKNVVSNWLPLDVAARSFLEIAESMKRDTPETIRVYHVVNADTSTRWADLLSWVEKLHSNVEAVPPSMFVEKLQELQREGHEHPAMRLIPHWKDAYGDVQDTNGEVQKAEKVSEHDKKGLTFDMERTYVAAPVLREVRPVDEAYFGKLWKWIQEQDHGDRK